MMYIHTLVTELAETINYFEYIYNILEYIYNLTELAERVEYGNYDVYIVTCQAYSDLITIILLQTFVISRCL